MSLVLWDDSAYLFWWLILSCQRTMLSWATVSANFAEINSSWIFQVKHTQLLQSTCLSIQQNMYQTIKSACLSIQQNTYQTIRECWFC